MKKMTIIMHSNDFDKTMSALILANGALAMGYEATIFFTFWGLTLLKKGKLSSGPLSKMNLLGIGKRYMLNKLKKNNIATAERLIDDYKELGGKIIACDMTMEIMNLKKTDLNESLIDGYGGVGAYMQNASDSDINLFI